MPIQYLSKSLFLKTILVLLVLATALTLSPFAKNLNLANDQDTDSCSNILYFPTINSSRDWQTTVSITNTECKSKQRRVNVTLTAYDKDGSSLGVIKNVTRLRGNKTKTINAQALPSGTESLKVESDGRLIANAIFKTKDDTKSEVIPAIKEPSQQLDFPALARNNDLYIYETITILNPNTTPASVDIIALDKDGYEIDHDTLSPLSSMESRDITLVDIFNGSTLKNLSTVRVVSDNNITGLQLMDYPDVDLVGLPALTTTSKVWTFPIVTQGENLDLWTKVGILNTGNDIASIMVEAFDASNRSLGIIHSQSLSSGATYFFSTVNIEMGIIPLNTAFLKVTSDQPISGYEVIGVIDGNGLTAAIGIPEENQTTVGLEITGSNDGEVLNAYSMVRMRDGSVKSTNGSFGDIKVAKRLLIAKHEKKVSITSKSPFPSDKITSSVKDCKKSFSGWDEDCLLEKLRDEAYFGISYDDVSDTQLLKYIEKNKKTIATLLLQIDYGRSVQSFIHNNGKVPIENEEGKIFLKTLKGATSFFKTLGDILNLIEEIPAWNAVSESVNVFGKILDGYKIYIKAKEVFTIATALINITC